MKYTKTMNVTLTPVNEFKNKINNQMSKIKSSRMKRVLYNFQKKKKNIKT